MANPYETYSTSSTSRGVQVVTSVVTIPGGSLAPVTVVVTPSFSTVSKSFPKLTTLFTPLDDCLSSVNEFSFSTSIPFQIAPTEAAYCYPSFRQLTYSPGICPSGYTIGVQTIALLALPSGTQTQTQNICCPSRLSFDRSASLCISTFGGEYLSGTPPRVITPSDTATFILWQDIRTTLSNGVTAATGIITPTLRPLRSSATIYAPAIVALYQSTDSAVSSFWASSLAAVVQSSASVNSNSSSQSGGSNASQSSGLSSGAIAGIAVGVLGAIILGIVVLLMTWRKRKRQYKLRPAREGPGSNDIGQGQWAKQELDGNTVQTKELDGQNIGEMQAHYPPPAELHGDHLVFEAQMLPAHLRFDEEHRSTE